MLHSFVDVMRVDTNCRHPSLTCGVLNSSVVKNITEEQPTDIHKQFYQAKCVVGQANSKVLLEGSSLWTTLRHVIHDSSSISANTRGMN